MFFFRVCGFNQFTANNPFTANCLGGGGRQGGRERLACFFVCVALTSSLPTTRSLPTVWEEEEDKEGGRGWLVFFPCVALTTSLPTTVFWCGFNPFTAKNYLGGGGGGVGLFFGVALTYSLPTIVWEGRRGGGGVGLCCFLCGFNPFTANNCLGGRGGGSGEWLACFFLVWL